MQTDSLLDRLMSTFLGELADHVRSLERDLLALERQSTPAVRNELFKTLFRTAHSLKGAARAVRVESIEAAAHRLEELFGSGRDGRVPIDAAYFEMVLPTVDELRATGRRLNANLGRGEDPPKSMEQAPPVAPELNVPQLESHPMSGGEVPDADPWSGMVRVATGKLDALLAQSGELLVARHRVLARAEAVRALQETTGSGQQDVRRIEQRVGGFLKNGTTRERGAAPHDDDRSDRSPRRFLEQLFGHHKAKMTRLSRDLQRLVVDLGADYRNLEQIAQSIDAEVRRVRMISFAEACEGLARMVRDLATSNDKKIEIAVEGGNIEIDRSVLDELRDPLVHLVRNSVDHGIESVAMRRASGKPDTGQIVLAAAIRGDRLEIVIRDDGRGLDLGAIRETVRQRGIAIAEDEDDLVEHIFTAGFTTASAVTTLSGRGIGLEIVKSKVQSMRGAVDVAFKPGQGTQFTLRVPLTLTAVRALIVRCGLQSFAVDTAAIDRVLRIAAADVQMIGGREVVMLAGRPVAIVTLAQLLAQPDMTAPGTDHRRPVIVLADGRRMAAIVVDDIQTEREVVLRPLGRRLRRIKHVSGSTVLPDGRIALVLNNVELLESARNLTTPGGVAQSMAAPQATDRKRLLLVDDSVTTRTLEKSILEAAGYEVLIATDGAEAWRALLERGADLVVSDVEMPHMDGFSLTEAIRSSRQFREIPVILMTARDSDADRKQGMKAGANAYLLKSAFDQRELLATIGQIL